MTFDQNKDKQLSSFLEQHEPITPPAPIHEEANIFDAIQTTRIKERRYHQWAASLGAVAAIVTCVFIWKGQTSSQNVFIENETTAIEEFVIENMAVDYEDDFNETRTNRDAALVTYEY